MKYAIADGETFWLRPTGDAELVKRTAKFLLGAKDPSVFQVLGIRNGVVTNSVPLPWFCEHNDIEKEVPSWRV